MDNIAGDLLRSEEALLNPAVRKDRSQVEKFLAEDFVEFGSSGRVWTRAGVIELLATETGVRVNMEDFVCKLLAPDIALVTYRAVRTETGSGLPISSLRSSIWTRKSGAWLLRFHQGTRLS
jgi:hypothetical protein